MRRAPLPLRWLDGSQQTQQETLLPIDLITRKEGEYLIATTGEGNKIELRLDQILN